MAEDTDRDADISNIGIFIAQHSHKIGRIIQEETILKDILYK